MRRAFLPLLLLLLAGITASVRTSAGASSGRIEALTRTRQAVVVPRRHEERPSSVARPISHSEESGDEQDVRWQPASLFAPFGDVLEPHVAGARAPRTPQRTVASPAVGYAQAGLDAVAAGGFEPADVALAVGPSNIVQVVNSALAIWQTGSPTALATQSLGDFMTTTTDDRRADFMTDPRAQYDPQSGRWFVVVFDVSRGEEDIAISGSADPTGGWGIYALPSAGCPDQPRIGIGLNFLVLTYDLFATCATRSGPYVGGVVEVIDKSDLVSGRSTLPSVFGPDPRYRAIIPAQPLEPAGNMYLVSTDYVASSIVLYTVNTIGQSVIPVQRIPVRQLVRAPPPPQKDTSQFLDPGDNRIQDAFLSNGVLWLSTNDGCFVESSTTLSGCLRYVALAPASGVVVDQREEALAGGRSAFYSAIRPDPAGHLFAIFGYSSATDYPSLGVIMDPGASPNYSSLSLGTAPNDSGRWGDYFAAARDPNDSSRVWVAGAYGSARSWSTTIASVSAAPGAAPPPTVAPPAADTASPRVTALSSSGVAGKSVHLLYRLWENTHQTREQIRLIHLGKAYASFSTPLGKVTDGQTVYVLWKAPRTAPPKLSFCVTAYDAAGNASRPSCASLRISGSH